MKNSCGILILFCLSVALSQFSVAQTLCSSNDIDTNDNNLIDICDVDGFNIIRDLEADFGGEDGYGSTDDGCHTQCNGYELMNNIDFTGVDHWQPIDYFNTTFNANVYTISNLVIHSNDASDYLGFFREIGIEAKIIGIRLFNITVDGDNRSGGLAGVNEGMIINSCIINQDTHRKIEGKQYVGGLVGDNVGGFINYSCAIVNVKGTNFIGGLVGDNNHAGTIMNSYALSTVKGNNYVGGLVGHHRKESIIANSYANANVNAIIAGGLVGWNDKSVITNSYATGDVAGTTMTKFVAVVGGLIGRNSKQRGIIRNSYAAGNVKGTGGAAGGLIGHIAGGIIENSYAIGGVSDTNEGDIGGLVGSIYSGGIVNSYAPRNDIDLIGFNNIKIENENNTTASFLSDHLREATVPSTIPTKIYYRWSQDDWDFGSTDQYPLLRYTSATDVINTPACNDPLSNLARLPRCGTLISGQQVGLTQLIKLPEGVILSPQFIPEVFHYTLTVSNDTTMMDFTPLASNRDAVIRITSEHGSAATNEDGSIRVTFGKNSDFIIFIDVSAAKATQRSTQYTVRLRKQFTIYTQLRILLEGILQQN